MITVENFGNLCNVLFNDKSEGFRLIAVSMLPLAEGSLIYGSEDAGVTVHAKGESSEKKKRVLDFSFFLFPTFLISVFQILV